MTRPPGISDIRPISAQTIDLGQMFLAIAGEEFETYYSGRTFTVVQLATLKGQLLS